MNTRFTGHSHRHTRLNLTHKKLENNIIPVTHFYTNITNDIFINLFEFKNLDHEDKYFL
jgi:hypothetical protein